MYQYVALTDGTTTIDLTSDPYALVAYAPGVAYRNDNELGPLYADVQDSITVHVVGCTAAECYANAAALNALLDQAWRWWQGETVAAVRLQIQAQDSTLALPLEAPIKGRAPGSPAPLALPEQWPELAGKYVIPDVTIQFVRYGQLLYPTAETGSSTASANPTVQSITISSPTAISSPTGLTCTFQNAGVDTAGYMDRGILLTASAASRLQIYDTLDFTYGTNVANFNDSANLARNTNVARYSPGVLASGLGAALAGFDSTARLVAVYAAVRPNTAATVFTIQLVLTSASGTTVAGPVTVVDSSALTPRIVFLGIVRTRQDISNVSLQLTASAASGTLDINYFAIQAIDDETSGALAVFDSLEGGHAGGIPLAVDTKILSEPTALVTSLSAGITYNLTYQGRPIFYTRGALVATILATDLTFWRVADGVTLLNTVFAATRYGAYLVPR